MFQMLRRCSSVGSARVIRSTRQNVGAPVTLTQRAKEVIRAYLQQRPEAKALKIGIKQRGCSGLAYNLEYVTEKGKFDEEVSINGCKLYIDPRAMLSILGTEIDYVQTKLSSEFVFRNPNVKATCGCGESFTV